MSNKYYDDDKFKIINKKILGRYWFCIIFSLVYDDMGLGAERSTDLNALYKVYTMKI